jgi:hypothetical protein
MVLASVYLDLKVKFVKKDMLSTAKYTKIETLFVMKDGLELYVFILLNIGDIKLCPGNCNDRGSCVDGKCINLILTIF